MFMNDLEVEDHIPFAMIVSLVAHAESPLLLRGRPLDSTLLPSDLEHLSIASDWKKQRVVTEWVADRVKELVSDYVMSSENVERKMLINQLRKFPVESIASTEVRLEAAKSVMSTLLVNNWSQFVSCHGAKIILFNAMLVGFFKGESSEISEAILKQFQHHYGIKEVCYHHLSECARIFFEVRETARSIILK